MHQTQGLVCAYLLDGEGGGRELSWPEIQAWQPSQGLLWVHLDIKDKHARHWLKQESGLDPYQSQALLVDESRPRSVIAKEGVLIFLRGVNHNPQQDPEDMVSIRVWLEKNRIITTRRRKLLSITDVCQSLDSGTGPKTPTGLLVMLNERLTDRISEVIEDIETQVDELEEEVLNQESYLLRPKIADLRRQSVMLRRYLAPQREALNGLYLDDDNLLTPVERLRIRESIDRVMRYIEDLDSARERAGITQEELSARLSEQMDRRMYVLSIAAVIFLPLTFLTGLLGINVAGIPGANYRWAFEIVCAILIAISAGMIWIFRKKKWM